MYRCVNNHRCADRIDGQAREVNGPNTFCDICHERTVERIGNLPRQYVKLHLMIGEKHAGIDAGIRRPKPGSVVPLNLHIDTLLGDIDYTTTLAAEIICDTMGLVSNPRGLDECATIIAWNLDRLLAVPEVDVMFWLRSGCYHGVTVTTGTHIVAALDALASLAHYTLGLTRARAQRDLPCTRCAACTVGRWSGSDDFDCTTCGARFPENDIRRQDKILLALHKRGLLKIGA